MKNTLSFGVAQALAVGMCLGLILSSSSCGTRPPTMAKCNKNTCDTGCCGDDGNCYGTNDAGLQANDACGLGGVSCTVCSSTQVCADGQCRLASAGGGTGGNGGSGGNAGAGGASGGTGGGSTDGGCTMANCGSGCCAANGTCVMPAQQNFTRCGTNAAMCAGCPAGKACMNGSCGAPNCSACLDASGNCRTDKVTLSDNSFCGRDGGYCAVCDTPNGQMCMDGRCVGTMSGCTPANCDGCCAGNTCIGKADGGISNAQCGTTGGSCTTCNSPATCDTASGTCMGGGTGGGGGTFPFPDGGLTTCDPTSCPTGCCNFLLGCLQDNMSLSGLGVACGTGGAVCQICLFAPDCATGMALGTCM